MKTEQFIIRPCQTQDEEAVIKLWFDCDLIVPWNNPREDIQRKLKVNPELFLAGLLNEKIIATVMGGYEGHRGWINYLAVAPQFRRLGFAWKLMDEIELKLKATGCPKINLQVREANQQVVQFYKAIGYKVEPLVNMGKRLAIDPVFQNEEGSRSS